MAASVTTEPLSANAVGKNVQGAMAALQRGHAYLQSGVSRCSMMALANLRHTWHMALRLEIEICNCGLICSVEQCNSANLRHGGRAGQNPQIHKATPPWAEAAVNIAHH